MKNVEQLKMYLADLVKLETEKYRLEEIKETLLDFRSQKEAELALPNDDKYNLYQKKSYRINSLREQITKEQEVIKNKSKNLNDIGLYFTIVPLIWFTIFFIFIAADAADIGLVVSFVLSACIVGYIYWIKNAQKNAVLNVHKEKLENLKSSLNQKIDNINVEYEKLIQESIINYDKHQNDLIILCNNNKQQVINLEYIYNEVMNKLNELYNLGIIFEKYRNLSAVTMFYEYFSSSRVFELEGKDGAYNLYELELRQNLIINNLKQINSNLEQIKDNQYCMYKELTNINSSLGVVNRSLSNIEDIEQSNIEINSEIAKNMEAIKTIQLYNIIRD